MGQPRSGFSVEGLKVTRKEFMTVTSSHVGCKGEEDGAVAKKERRKEMHLINGSQRAPVIYLAVVDRNEAIEKAKQFAQTAYAAASNEILLKGKDEIPKMRANLAARGIAMSGTNVHETARILGEQHKALTHAHLDAILEGYELHGVEITDQMAGEICDQVIAAANNRLASASRHVFHGVPVQATAMFPQLLGQHSGISTAWVKTEIDRRTLMAKKNISPTTNYYVQGENARVNVNSTDHSVNVVMKSTEEFFGTIRQRIKSGIPEGEERRKILEALTALEESHGKPSFAQRYTELISSAADYVTLLTPFIPALTEMLGHVLK
jgi:hypothetical protein